MLFVLCLYSDRRTTSSLRGIHNLSKTFSKFYKEVNLDLLKMLHQKNSTLNVLGNLKQGKEEINGFCENLIADDASTVFSIDVETIYVDDDAGFKSIVIFTFLKDGETLVEKTQMYWTADLIDGLRDSNENVVTRGRKTMSLYLACSSERLLTV